MNKSRYIGLLEYKNQQNKNMNKRILVIGGACKYAENLIDEKLREGFEVVCIDNLSTSNLEDLSKFNTYRNFIFIKHDLNNPFFIEVSEIYSFISNPTENVLKNINKLKERNKIVEGALMLDKEQEIKPTENIDKNKDIKTISIIGTGYVGLAFAAILSNVGYKVYAVDVDEKKINIVKSGKSYYFDPGIDEFVKNGIDKGTLIPTISYNEAISNSDVAFICVGTPETEDGSTNLSYVFSAVKDVVKNAKKNIIIVQKSTVPVGTAKEIKRIINEFNDKNLKIDLLSNPEFLREGSAIFDTLFFDRVVLGGDENSAKRVVEIYRTIDNYSKNLDVSKISEYAFFNINPKYIENMTQFDKRVVIATIESAELIKVTANSFLALKISFANTIGRICDKVGADSKSVMDGVGMDHRIGRACMNPGLEYGGDCFPKDVASMVDAASSFGVNFGIMHEVINVNKTQVYFVVDKIKKILGMEDLHDKVIGILGLSFKAGTSDLRNSPAIRLIKKLIKNGAIIKAYDPKSIENTRALLGENNIIYCDKIEDVFYNSEMVALTTEWKEFIEFDYTDAIKVLKNPIFLDCRCAMDPKKMESFGFKFERI